jgi:peptidoglycan/xylan/chitin deacetylase (PgdA/CDA1 family)
MFDAGEAIRKLVLHVARYTGVAPLARPFVGGVGAILMLHRVTARVSGGDSANRHLSIHPQFLDALLTQMKQDGYEFVDLDGAVERLELRNPAARRFAVVTADDGFRDNLLEALPVLERHQAPMTIYVAPALIDGTAFMWWEVVEAIVARSDVIDVPGPSGPVRLDSSTPVQKRAANRWLQDHFSKRVSEAERDGLVAALAIAHGVDPDQPRRDLLMDWNELARVAAHPLITIGAHTVNHFNLRRLDEADALSEMVGSADMLEERLGRRPRHLAYPYGFAEAAGAREVDLARRAGFATAVTTRHGLLQPGHAAHVHALPRISVNGRYQRLAHMRTLLSGVTTPLANSGKRLVTV